MALTPLTSPPPSTRSPLPPWVRIPKTRSSSPILLPARRLRPSARPPSPPARVELPSRDDFNTGGENADEFDPCAYATALGDLLSQLQIALEGEGIDAISATYPLLSFNTEPVGTGPYHVRAGLPGAG